MFGILIECDRQFSTGIVLAEKNVGYSFSTSLTSVPCLDDGVSVLMLGFQSNGRAGAVHENNLLAHLLQIGNPLALHFGQFDADAVASLEAFLIDFHLLTFQTWGYAAYEDDGVGILYFGQEVLVIPAVLHSEVEQQHGMAGELYIFYADRVLLSCLHVARQA